ncbi:MAG: HD domain-containing protein [Thermacetogeniaceae bacterium]
MCKRQCQGRQFFCRHPGLSEIAAEHKEHSGTSLDVLISRNALPLRSYSFVVDERELILNKLKDAYDEIDAILATLFPDSRIETRLKEIVEYADTIDSETGKAKITRRIEQGGYLHVLSILRILADVMRQGLMELPGIERSTLVEAAVFYDIGKVQPELEVGEIIVDPLQVFEDGKIHAARGAEIAEGFYKVGENAAHLIRYHHHEESELPPSFPSHLLPMYRLFRMLDSLSAGMTRRQVQVRLEVSGTRLAVDEYSTVPKYNCRTVIDLYTGDLKKTALLPEDAS